MIVYSNYRCVSFLYKVKKIESFQACDKLRRKRNIVLLLTANSNLLFLSPYSIYSEWKQILCYYLDDSLVKWDLIFKTQSYETLHNSYFLG